MKLCFILFCQLLHGGYCSKIIYIFFVKQLLLRQLMYISVLLQSFSKSESPKRFQQLKSNKDFVNGIFQSLPKQYTHEVSGDWKGGEGQCHFPCILHFYSRADNHKIIFFFQLTDSVYKGLFELYNQRGKAGKLFVLQFVPVLIWNYLSATTRRDHQVQYNNLHEGLNTFIQ